MNRFIRKDFQWFSGAILRYKVYLAEIVMAAFLFQLLGLVVPLCTQVIIDKVIVNRGLVTLNGLAIGMVIVILFQLIMDSMRRYLFSHTTNKIDIILGTALFRHLMQLPLQYFIRRRAGDILMKVSALENVREFLTKTAINACIDIVFSVVFFAVMFYYSFTLGLIALAAVPVQIALNIWGASRYRKRITDAWNYEARNQAFLVEAVAGIDTVKALSLEPRFRYHWEAMLSRSVCKSLDAAQMGAGLNEGVSLVQRVTSYLIIWAGGVMVISSSLTIGQFIAFQMIANQAAAPLLRLAQVWQSFQQMKLSMERIGDLIHAEREPGWDTGTASGAPCRGDIVFQNVSFSYESKDPPALDDVSLHIKPGQRIGIVGCSGSGKSTIAKLLDRLYLPQGGRILLDGQDIRELSLSALRQQIGIVLQENRLFPGTINENISYGMFNADPDAIQAAAALAGADEFIRELPEGYDTELTDDGSNLSGGQRQRIAIARVLLRKPKILIFDEATSALDYISERIVMQNMSRIAQGRTTLIIAHRLANVQGCDMIFVMDHGHVAEKGTHAELMEKNGAYRALWDAQKG